MDIKAFRDRKGISQARLAALLGFSQSTICRFELGDLEPDARTLLALALLDTRLPETTPA